MRNESRSRCATVLTVAALALAGGGAIGCGGDDNEGPAEEAGKKLDDAGGEAKREAKDAVDAGKNKD